MVRMRRAFAVTGLMLLIGAALPAAGAVGAQASASPAWRVVKYFGACESIGAWSVTATGARDAWTTGEAFRFQCDSPGLLIAHWDGRTWRELPPPRAFSGLSHDSFGTAVAALSASYSWTFVNRATVPPAETEQSFALLRSGHRWRAFRLPDGLRVTSAWVFSHSDAWAFGTIIGPQNAPKMYAEHFNGRNWRPVSAPVTPYDAAFPGPRNIWVVGRVHQPTPPRPVALVRWTGRWQKPIPFPASITPNGATIFGSWVVPSGAHGAWVAVSDFNSSDPNAGGALLHWTGSRWQIIKVPFPTFGLGPLVRDGHGGLWIGSATCPGCDANTIYHYSAGTWSKASLNIPGLIVTAMRLIPGTDSVWASGSVQDPNQVYHDIGAVLKYGP